MGGKRAQVIGVTRDDDRARARCNHGDVGVDNVGRCRLGEQQPDGVGLGCLERDNVATSQEAPQWVPVGVNG